MTEFERKLREELREATTTKQVDGIRVRYKHSGIDWREELDELIKSRWIHLSLCERSEIVGVPVFRPFQKIPRLNRTVTLTEKLDGSNACVYVSDWGDFAVGSRTRWVTPQDDNHGFARWAYERKDELLKLGPGTHFGEWWGQGVNYSYGLKEKRFSLFNTQRWCRFGETPKLRKVSEDPRVPAKLQDVLPECVGLVPVLYEGLFSTEKVNECVESLRKNGSVAVPGQKAEGVVVFHHAANTCFKVLCEKDEEPKGKGG